MGWKELCRLTLYMAVMSLCCFTLTGCAKLLDGGLTNYGPECERANALQEKVDAIMALRPYGAIPDHFYEDDFIKQEGDFDPNVYFSILEHVSMEPGYVLDYVYMADEMAGRPLIYARQAEQPPYATLGEYMESENADHQPPYTFLNQFSEYLAHVQVDDTPEGYLEFVALYIMGDQFYLDWHANYNDHKIISNADGLDAALDAAGRFLSEEVPASLTRKAARLDFTPTVTLTQDEAIVRLVTFTKWGGFSQIIYTINREFPHTFVDWEATTLLDYDCGLMF